MAPRRPPQRRGSQSPNTILVIFLIFFVLGTILAGVLAYYGYDGQNKLKDAVKTAEAKAKGAQEAQRWAVFQSYIARKALVGAGGLIKNDKTDEENEFNEGLLQFSPEGAITGAPFKDEATKAAVENMFAKAKKDLGWDGANKKFLTTYRAQFDKLTKEVTKAQGDYQTALNEKEALKGEIETMARLQKKFYKTQGEAIATANDKALADVEANTKQMKKYLDKNTELNDKLKETKETYEAKLRLLRKEKHDVEVLLTAAKKEAQAPDGGEKAAEGGPAPRAAAAVHALALDVSQGKPLWDRPVAKITRVDPQGRKVTLDRGSAQGIRPQMTFTVFAAGPGGGALGPLKGTVEVQDVLGGNSAVAWITSLYDASGVEIPLNDNRGLRTSLRQNDNPIREGDLLFNLAVGAHVAIAGAPGWTGGYNLSPTEQMRQVRLFMALLKKEGVTVDAYLDLADGAIMGKITSRTNYFIHGEMPRTQGADAAEPAAKVGKAVLENAAKMRESAVKRGAFIINVDNFLAVIGYRTPHSADEPGATGFQPSVIAGGTGQIGQTLGGNGGKAKEKQKQP